MSAASGATPEEDLASEPPLLPPDADVMLTAEEGRNIIGGQVIIAQLDDCSLLNSYWLM